MYAGAALTTGTIVGRLIDVEVLFGEQQLRSPTAANVHFIVTHKDNLLAPHTLHTARVLWRSHAVSTARDGCQKVARFLRKTGVPLLKYF